MAEKAHMCRVGSDRLGAETIVIESKSASSRGLTYMFRLGE